MTKLNSLFSKIESILLKLSIVCVLLLIGLQGLVSSNDISVFLNESGYMEEIPIESEVSRKTGIIILRVEDESFNKTEILLNGEVIASFKKSKEVEIKVHNNDLIEVNGTMYNNIIKFKVVGISKNISTPKLNTLISTSQSIEILGKVTLK